MNLNTKRGKKAQDTEAGEKAKTVLEKKENDSKEEVRANELDPDIKNIVSTGSDRKEAKNGAVETHYGNGQLESRETYKNGERNGLSEFWYPNGQLRERTIYKDEKPEGLRETWYKNGQLGSRSNYKDGKYSGLWENWYANGQQESRALTKDG